MMCFPITPLKNRLKGKGANTSKKGWTYGAREIIDPRQWRHVSRNHVPDDYRERSRPPQGFRQWLESIPRLPGSLVTYLPSAVG
jgi:hypothetical protein